MSSKVAVVLGTRPEAIKLAPVIRILRKSADIDCSVCLTAQHRHMLDQALKVFDLEADADLDLMTADQSLAGFTAKAISALDGYLKNFAPDLVLLQGDTTTVFCAALSAFYQGIPIGHVEAGLRTWNPRSPWPEEMNRVLTTRLAELHFAPTHMSAQNLLREGIQTERIFITGNTVIDALNLALTKIRQTPPQVLGLPDHVLSDTARPLVLITAHRRENFGTGFQNICAAIAALADQFQTVSFVYPVHLNPRVREAVSGILSARQRPNLHLIEPVAYLPFVRLMSQASIILTDSGGIQEEALSLGKPVLVMRDTTERPEGVACGAVRLVGIRFETIVAAVTELLTDPAAYSRMVCRENPYGDGKASERIVAACGKYLGVR